MLRIHFLQPWFSLSDLAMEEALFDTPLYREFVKLDAHNLLSHESTILHFRHWLGRHKLADQILPTTTCWSSAARCSEPARQSMPH